jgi:hypothetical protein
MEKLFPLPLYNFLKIAGESGGISYKRLSHVTPWIFKTILVEPFRWIELVTKKDLISQHEITRHPVFILGYYRSGTTFLQQLFRQDCRLGFTSAFKMLFPEIMLSCENWMTPFFEKMNKVFKVQNHIHRIPFTLYSTGEEDVAMSSYFKRYGAQWGYLFPENMNDYFQSNSMFENASVLKIRQWKKDYLLLLKKISLANNGKQLVLKNPPNTARIRLLLSIFPGAKFIFIRRNPFELFASNKRLWEVVIKNYALGNDKNLNTTEVILSTYATMMDHYLNEKNLVNKKDLVEISYEDLISNPAGTMESVYNNLNLNDFNFCKTAVTRFSEIQKNYRKLDHKLSRQELDLISINWRKYLNEFGYKMHHESMNKIWNSRWQ